MNDQETAVRIALRDVWHRHRDTVVADLEALIGCVRSWNGGSRTDELSTEIRDRSHRIRGSLTMVGHGEGVDDLRTIETHAIEDRGPYAKEVVDRVHDLLEHLRTVD